MNATLKPTAAIIDDNTDLPYWQYEQCWEECTICTLSRCDHCEYEHAEVTTEKAHPCATAEDVLVMWGKLWPGKIMPDLEEE